jgi:hypothetical protein
VEFSEVLPLLIGELVGVRGLVLSNLGTLQLRGDQASIEAYKEVRVAGGSG